MSRSATARASAPEADAVLTKATLRAARLLGVPQSELAGILGVSPATLSRYASGQKRLEAGTKAWEIAALFVRLFRSLDAIVGSDDAAARAWLRSENTALGGVPLELVGQVAGLVRTVDYLDAARGRV